MTREEIESVYSRDVLDRNWWGNFPEPLDLLGKDFPKTADIYRLMPVCARIWEVNCHGLFFRKRGEPGWISIPW